MRTLLLDRTVWDLCLDTTGNIAIASDPYSIAQDVASAIKLFQGELWFNTLEGLPYFSQILGEQPPVPLLKAKFIAAALTVPGVTRATCYINAITDRVVSGQVQVTDRDGNQTTIGF
jgi:hypothetical protein